MRELIALGKMPRLMIPMLLAVVMLITACGAPDTNEGDDLYDDAVFGDKAAAVNAILDGLHDGGDLGFIAKMSRVSDGLVGTYTLEDPVQILFTADEDMYLYIAYVDAQGTFSVIELDNGRGAGHLPAGETVFAEADLVTHPPLGWERAYYVGTMNPVDQSAFNPFSELGGEMSMFAMQDSLALAEMFVEAVAASNAEDEVSAVALDSLIVPREEGPRYTWEEIGGFYLERGLFMGIEGISLESGISFEADSAELSEDAMRELDVWAEAIGALEFLAAEEFPEEPISFVFEIGGHTDASESADAAQLSEERAIAVRDYLTGLGLSEDLLSIAAYGADQPVERLDDSNSRVEFTFGFGG